MSVLKTYSILFKMASKSHPPTHTKEIDCVVYLWDSGHFMSLDYKLADIRESGHIASLHYQIHNCDKILAVRPCTVLNCVDGVNDMCVRL